MGKSRSSKTTPESRSLPAQRDPIATVIRLTVDTAATEIPVPSPPNLDPHRGTEDAGLTSSQSRISDFQSDLPPIPRTRSLHSPFKQWLTSLSTPPCAVIRGRSSPVGRFLNQLCLDRVHFNVMQDPLEFPFIAHDVVIRFRLPERSLPLQQLIASICREAANAVHDAFARSPISFGRLAREMDDLRTSFSAYRLTEIFIDRREPSPF